jgi:adenylate cyclase
VSPEAENSPARRARGRAFQGLALGLAAGLLAVLLWWSGALNPWERATWSWRARFWAEPSAYTDRVKIIALDQASLDWASENSGLGWPWPRQAYSMVLSYLQRAGARAVIFDVLFTEPSTVQGDDQDFAQAVAQAGNFVGSVFLAADTGSATTWPEGYAAKIPSLAGGPEWLAAGPARVMPRALLPVKEIALAAKVLANVREQPDPDQVVRSATLVRGFDGRAVASLSLAPLLMDAGEQARLQGDLLLLGDKSTRLDNQGRMLLRYRGPAGTHRKFSAAAVIQSELRLMEGGKPTIDDASIFKDCYVFFGFTAPGLHDLRATPVDPLYPGVEVHATALDNLLAGDSLRPGPPWLAAAYTLVLAMLCGLVGVRAGKAWQSVLAFVLLPPLPLLLGFALYQAGLWWPVINATLAVGLALVGAVLLNYATEGRQKRFIKSAFKHYLSPLVIERILADPDSLRLGGERRELSILFSDLAGFTSLSEGLDPEELTALLNEYLSEMSDFILAEGGTLDKYEGDAIIAFWNAPLNQPEHALAACRAALKCQRRLAEREAEYMGRLGRPLRARIGINTGLVVVGNMGSRQRFDYTVLGDAANLASRLEGANKVFGTPLMVSEATWQKTDGKLDGRRLGRLRVVGRSQPVTVYQPLAPAGQGDPDLIRIFEEGLDLLERGQWDQALERFVSLGDDPAAKAYLARLRELFKNEEPDWDGVWNLTSK